ncbi:MAG: heavy metal-responsive transcriptional regulator [Thermoanaerobaculia bacterium]
MSDRTGAATLSIGQLARLAGVRVDTVRYYERRGLLPRAGRRPSGYRAFPPDSGRRLRFVRHAQELGFTLEEIRELLALRVDRRRSCADVRALATEKLAEIDGKLERLQGIRTALASLAAACSGRGPTSECPLLEALDQLPEGGRR